MVHFLRDEDVIPFLRAIHERPDDDLPRLIFADWLDERGDWRGPLLRRPSYGDSSDPVATEVWNRWLGPDLEGIYDACQSGLLSVYALPNFPLRGPLPSRLAEALRQGWVRELAVKQHQFARLSAADLAEVPGLNIGEFMGGGWDVLQGLPRLRSLTLTDESGRLTDTAMTPVSNLSQLRYLRLSGEHLTDATLEAVARLTGLELLILRHCRRFTDAGLARLGGLARLRKLTLLDCPLVSEAGAARLREAIPDLAVYVIPW
jgi:uncharacterized protein (TIGR02996 family)